MRPPLTVNASDSILYHSTSTAPGTKEVTPTMPPVAVPALPEILPATPSDAKIPARKWAGWLYIGAVTAVGGLLLIRFTPRTFSNVLLTVALLGASLLLSNFKLRLPLWRGVSTMSMACAADLLALMILGADVAMLTSLEASDSPTAFKAVIL